MEPIQRHMVFCCAEQWMGGRFYQAEPLGDGFWLDCRKHSVGVYCMAAVDSGENGFSWTRAVVEAELPPDTALRVYAYASDTRRWGEAAELDEYIRGLEGNPLPALYQVLGPPAAESGDFYLGRNGRYLWLMFELAATGTNSPVVRRLSLRMGGDHMTDYLPAIYQGDDFTYRFLSIFDSMFLDLEEDINHLPARLDYQNTDPELLRYLASWVCVEPGEAPEKLRERISSALSDYEDRYTREGVRRSVRRLTGQDPILIEQFDVSPNRPDCRDPELYRRLYGEDPYRLFILLREQAFSSRRELEQFHSAMSELIPAGMSMQLIQLRPCVQLDWHTYLGINSRISDYVPAAIDEHVTIHYDTTIGGANHE